MAAGYTVKGSALSDPRFALLARRAGLADADHAIGKLGRVWSYCADEHLYAIAPEVFDVVSGVDGLHEHAVSVGLADRTEKGLIRVCGTRGRIEWKKKLRENAMKGGGQTKAKWQAKRRPNEGQTPGPSSSSSSSSSQISSRSDSDTPSEWLAEGTLPGFPIVKAPPPKRVKHEIPADWAPSAAHRDLAGELRLDVGREAQKFRLHAEANARKCVRWDSAFAGWLRRANEFSTPPPRAAGSTAPGHSTFRDLYPEERPK